MMRWLHRHFIPASAVILFGTCWILGSLWWIVPKLTGIPLEEPAALAWYSGGLSVTFAIMSAFVCLVAMELRHPRALLVFLSVAAGVLFVLSGHSHYAILGTQGLTGFLCFMVWLHIDPNHHAARTFWALLTIFEIVQPLTRGYCSAFVDKTLWNGDEVCDMHLDFEFVRYSVVYTAMAGATWLTAIYHFRRRT